MKKPELLEIHSLINRPGVLSFAVGMPAWDLLPAEAFQGQAASGLVNREVLQYQQPFAPLQRHLVEVMARRGVSCREEEIFLCHGSQQALCLLSMLLLDPGVPMIVEERSYEGMMNAAASREPEVLTVPTSLEHGIDLDVLEGLLTRGISPGFVYTMPEGHNPLGMTLAREPRRRLIELARRRRVPIIEDDAYGLLSYDGEAMPALRALDDTWVLYVGSLSKVLAPALRVGWIVAPEQVVHKLSQIKHGLDLHVSNLAWRAALSFFENGGLPRHLQRVRKEYRRRRDAMLQALAEHFPQTARWSHPRSGLYVWVELAPGTDTSALLRRSVEEIGVAFCPGSIFSAAADPAAGSSLRLCFGPPTPEQIASGIRDLGRLISR